MSFLIPVRETTLRRIDHIRRPISFNRQCITIEGDVQKVKVKVAVSRPIS